jgi:cyclopropane fatty-acyl-phospholipid synthase-like methyltransferase
MSEPESLSAACDAIADAWRLSRTGDPFRERPFLERLLAPLPPKARILDLGCGCGEPIARFLSTSGFEVTGVDTSARLLTYARRAVPEATFLHGDMRTVGLEGRFDGIVAWDSVFHLPRTDHGALFLRLWRWLLPGGRVLLSLGGSGAAEITSEMFGATFFYSGHEPEHARGLLRKAGFRIDHWEVDDPSSHGHIAVIAVRDAT